MSFTSDEALILAFGSDIVSHNFDDDYRRTAHSAYRKIDAILPPDLQDQVAHLKSDCSFGRRSDWMMNNGGCFVRFGMQSLHISGFASNTLRAMCHQTCPFTRCARLIHTA